MINIEYIGFIFWGIKLTLNLQFCRDRVNLAPFPAASTCLHTRTLKNTYVIDCCDFHVNRIVTTVWAAWQFSERHSFQSLTPQSKPFSAKWPVCLPVSFSVLLPDYLDFRRKDPLKPGGYNTGFDLKMPLLANFKQIVSSEPGSTQHRQHIELKFTVPRLKLTS